MQRSILFVAGPLALSVAGVSCVTALPAPEVRPSAPLVSHEPCSARASFETVLGDDTTLAHVEWLRCGPAEAAWTDDGGITYPRDRLTLTLAGAQPILLYANEAEPGLDELDYVRATHVGTGPGAQLLYSVHSYGTGNIHDWKILDRANGKLRAWTTIDPKPGPAALLHPGEHVGKQVGLGVVQHDGLFVETLAVYRNDDPNCCPTGGALSIELVPENGMLRVRRQWRHPLP